LPSLFVRSYIQRQIGAFKYRNCWGCAAEHWRRALELHPQSASSRYLLGTYHLREGRLEDAKAELQASLRLDPDFKAVYANLGAVLLELSELHSAAEVSCRGLQRHPRTPQCAQNLALARARFILAEMAAAGNREGSDLGSGCRVALAGAVVEGLAEAAAQLRAARGRARPLVARSDGFASLGDLLSTLAMELREGPVEVGRLQPLIQKLDDVVGGLDASTIVNLRP